ncbi:MAG TPA: hypothetical protein VFT98_05720 [Myxococcota bacterium]|nr:hypothetical protein [Myxococcota bacterium]
MRVDRVLRLAGFTLLSLIASISEGNAGESPAYGTAPQGERWAICQVAGIPIPGKTAVVRGPGGRRSYFSGVMRLESTAPTDLGAAFGAFIAQKYGLPNGMSVSGNCATAGSRADAEKTLKYWKESDAKYNYGGEQVDTVWQAEPAQASSPPPAS